MEKRIKLFVWKNTINRANRTPRWAKAPTKTMTTQASHFFAAVLAYTKLEVLKLKCGISHFRLEA